MAKAALLFHPFPLSAAAWGLVAAELGPVRALAIDAPGFGGAPAHDGPDTMEELARLGLRKLDESGMERAVIAGCSMGGYAALAFAELFPERVAGAVLISTRASADTEQAKANRERQALLALAQGPQPVIDEFLPKLSRTHRDEVARLAAQASAQGLASALRGMALRPDRSATLQAWRWPTEVLAGEDDQIVPLEEAQRLAAAIPNAALHVLRGAGHLPLLEQPREIARAILRVAASSPQ